LEDELNGYLATEYRVDNKKRGAYDNWLKSHKPFHWFVEFHGIMKSGGFDVIVGNPPFVEYSKVRDDYRILGYSTEDSGNLYAFVVERSAYLAARSSRIGLITPIALISVSETESTRRLMLDRFPLCWLSSFAIRPAKLFEGVEQRLTICLAQTAPSPRTGIETTKFNQWYKDERPTIFQRLEYCDAGALSTVTCIPKLGTPLTRDVVARVAAAGQGAVADVLDARGSSRLYFHRTPGYWIRVMDFEPHFRSPTATRSIHHIRELRLRDRTSAGFIGATVSSSLYFTWFFAVGNCRNLTLEDVKLFRTGRPADSLRNTLAAEFHELMRDYQRNSVVNRRGVTEFQEFDWGASKEIVDRIDEVLAEHYRLSPEQLDHVVNYDLKIRMNRDAGEAGSD